MGKSRRNRSTGPERRAIYTRDTPPRLPTRWARARCCGATIAADPGRMGRNWADVHEAGCPVPWEALGLDGPPRQVYPGAPGIPPGTRLRAVNRKTGAVPVRPEFQAAERKVS